MLRSKDAVLEKRKKFWSILVLITATSVLFLCNWVADSSADAHVMPRVERCDLKELSWLMMRKDEMLHLLEEQTGLCKKTIFRLLGDGRGRELLQVQEIYFAPTQVESFQTTPLTVSEWLVGKDGRTCKGMPLVDVQNGDILITKNSRFLGWRNGHVGLVVDADKGLVLEALMLGTPSKLCSMERWENYPSFQVLRLKEEYSHGEYVEWSGQISYIQVNDAQGSGDDDFGERLSGRVATYAKENLVDIPYHLLADVLRSSKTDELAMPLGTHCAHLVWYAYKQFGIDLDSDGGIIVTPEDIRNSPYLEVVQSYGY